MLFVAIINDLMDEVQLFCQLFAINTQIGVKSADVDLIPGGLDKTTP